VRIVLDTNVLASGLLFSGPPATILVAVESGRIGLVLTPEVIEEYNRVVGTLLEQYPRIGVSEALDRVIASAEIFAPITLLRPVCTDPDDDKFFACALAGKARLIVSGDKHLRNASGSLGVDVLTPRDFLDGHLRD
jgi:putative PIN family toxin of toxin-antitoxin system